jgi:hypothetical protein
MYITNVVDAVPDYTVGFEKGQPVLTHGLKVLQINGDTTLMRAHSGRILDVQVSCNLTLASPPDPFMCIVIPETGVTVTVTPVGGTQINGSTSAITRSAASNPAGFAILPTSTSGSFKATGS